MKKADTADRLEARADPSKAVAREAVDGLFAVIGEAMPTVRKSRLRESEPSAPEAGLARTGRNPRTGEAVSISASTSPTFKAGKTLKDVVNADVGP